MMAAPAVTGAWEMTGVYAETGQRVNARWVAIYRSPTGRSIQHTTLPLTVNETAKADAEAYARENLP